MNKLMITLFFSIGVVACSDHDHGPDADHGHANTEKPLTQTTEDHGHDPAGEHAHEHDDDHDHAPQTEAFYGEEADTSGAQESAPTTIEPDQTTPETEDHHSHQEGDHDHHH